MKIIPIILVKVHWIAVKKKIGDKHNEKEYANKIILPILTILDLKTPFKKSSFKTVI